jgi:hypothetical protein
MAIRDYELKNIKGVTLEDHNLGFYNDFAFSVEFMKRALDIKNQWETIHISEDAYIPFFDAPNEKNTAGKNVTKEEAKTSNELSYIFERDALDPIRALHPKRFGVMQVSRDNEYAPVKKPNKEDGSIED